MRDRRWTNGPKKRTVKTKTNELFVSILAVRSLVVTTKYYVLTKEMKAASHKI